MKSLKFFLFLFSVSSLCYGQVVNCPNSSVFIHTGGQIIEQLLPLPAVSNTILTVLPPSSNGLAIGPSLGFMAPNPTFWTVSGGTYWYHNGTTWINTTHSPGNPGAVNIGGGGNCLYNLVGGTGQVYMYNGTGNGTLLTTVVGFAGGGPYDIGADMNDNFYLVKATTPNPSLYIFDPTGSVICSYSLSNLPAVNSGGGFAIINNLIAVYNSGFSMGAINPASTQITFTAQSSIISPSDFANCVIPVPTGIILAPQGSTLNCSNTSLPLIAEVMPGGIGMMPGPASSALTSCNYFWSGPGIVSGQNTASITVNQPGVYTFSVCSSGCPVQQVVKSHTVTSMGLLLTPTITAPTCFPGTSTTNLSVLPAASSNTVLWSGPGILGQANSATLSINSPGIYTVNVTNTVGCSGTETVNVLPAPVISLALSSISICAQGLNGSVNALTITPSGANSYTLLTSPNFSYNLPAPWVCYPVGAPSSVLSTGSVTVIGSTGVCSSSAVAVFSIIPNPTIAIAPQVSSVCSGFSKTFTATGASAYNWLPVPGLNSFSGANVVANPLITSIFSAYGSNQGCNSATKNNTLNILPIPTVFANPSNATVCAGYNATLSASGTANSFTWSSSASPSQVMASSMNVNPLSQTSFTVIGSLNSCTNSAIANISTVAPPLPNMIFNTNTVCAQPLNGSPNSINVIPSGAINYTLLNGSNFSVVSAFGSGMTILPIGTPLNAITLATATLIGSNGFCQVSATQNFSIIPNPVIVSSPATAIICPGSSTLLNVSGASTYAWSLNNPGLNTYIGSSVIASPTITTVYSVIGESLGCQSMAQVNVVNISALPSILVTVSSPTICSGTAAILKASGNSSSYSWLPAIGLSGTTGASVLATPSVSQTYTVIGSLNNCTSTAVTSLSVILSPTLQASASAYTVCSGTSVHLYVHGANTYNWLPSTGPNSTFGQNIIANPLGHTTFTVLGFNGVCTGSATVFVKTVAIPDIKMQASDNQLCIGGTIPLRVTGAQVFNWFPVESLSASSGPTVMAQPQINTNYTVIGVNSDGSVSCSQQVSYSVMVLPYAKAIVGSNKNICMGDQTYLSVSGGNTYVWTPAYGLNKTNGTSVIASPTVSTVYMVQASFNGNCGTTNTVAVNVKPKPVVYAGRDTVFNLDEVMTIQSQGNGILKWISGENILCRDCPVTQVSPRVNNCYVVQATNEFGCKAQDEVCITLTDNYAVYFPNSFTPNGDGLNDVFLVAGVGIFDVKMEIYDRWGEQLFSSKEQSNGWDGTYKGVDCKAGIYTYRIFYKGLNGKNFERAGTVSIIR